MESICFIVCFGIVSLHKIRHDFLKSLCTEDLHEELCVSLHHSYYFTVYLLAY